jgi:hypothetical protein
MQRVSSEHTPRVRESAGTASQLACTVSSSSLSFTTTASIPCTATNGAQSCIMLLLLLAPGARVAVATAVLLPAVALLLLLTLLLLIVVVVVGGRLR